MYAILRNVLLLLIGSLLAVIFVYGGWASPFFRSINRIPPSDVSAEQVKEAENKSLSYQEEKWSLLRDEYSPAERLELLKSALEEGTLDSLQLLRLEYLQRLGEYSDKVLPALKKQGLESLRSRFSESDWKDWPRASFNVMGGPSSARLFVDDVTGVNPQLGAYLDTAAYLYHGLHSQTWAGELFVVKDSMQNLIENAERILSHRKSAAIPARFAFSAEILRDPAFRTSLERERCRIVANYIKAHREGLKKNIELLSSLEPGLCPKATFDVVSEVILRVATRASVRLREEILFGELEIQSLRRFAERSRREQELLAELFALGAVDGLSRGNYTEATTFLRESASILPGLRAQEMVAVELAKAKNQEGLTVAELTGVGEAEQERSSPRGGLERESAPPPSSTSEGSTISGGLIVLVIGLLGFLGFGFFFLRNRWKAFELEEAVPGQSRRFSLGRKTRGKSEEPEFREEEWEMSFPEEEQHTGRSETEKEQDSGAAGREEHEHKPTWEQIDGTAEWVGEDDVAIADISRKKKTANS